MDDILSTPVQRAGPSSRLIRRQSGLPEKPRNLKEQTMERSFRALDDAIGSPTQTFTQRTGFNISHMPKGLPNLENTMFMPSSARDRSVFPQADVTRTGRVFDETIMKFDNNQSIMSATLYSADLEENPGVQGTENLFNEFLSVMNTGSVGLETLPEFEDMLAQHIRRLRQLLISLPTFRDKNPKTAAVCEDLINERNTWRILSKLYTDRLITSLEETDPDTAMVAPLNPNSEKRIIEKFFLTNKEVRQAHIVVDWLEKNSKDANERMITQQMEWFTDATICWENTTAALYRDQVRPGMVKQLDPDAPNRNGLVLHELDVEDDSKLLSCMMNLVRCGLLDEAQELCNRLGQSWRAATLEGWKLYHDPNYESGTDGRGDKLPIEGNKHRDIWKKVAWCLTKDKSMLQMERTIYAALCANLEQLRSVCTQWEDKLWAGAKCAVDVLVETEIRSQIIKNFAELPTEYWNSSTSLSKVIAEASSGLNESSNVNKYRKIQSHIIMDDYPGLLASMVHWVKDGSGVEAHLLRLMCHLVLVHRSLAIHGDPASEETILTKYTTLEFIKFLMSF
jgi:nuclear pore complex protein Nup107